jgi:hypothetical protein
MRTDHRTLLRDFRLSPNVMALAILSWQRNADHEAPGLGPLGTTGAVGHTEPRICHLDITTLVRECLTPSRLAWNDRLERLAMVPLE